MYVSNDRLKPTKFWTRLSVFAAVAVLITGSAVALLNAHGANADQNDQSAPAPVVQIVSPTDNENVSGIITLKFYVQNLSTADYMPFWAVDNGQWNLMGQDSSTPNVMSQQIDVSGWNWSPTGTYTLSLIALQKSNWQPIQTTVRIHIGTPLSPMASTPASTQQSPVQTPTPVAAVTQSVTNQSQLFVDPTSSTAVGALAAVSNNSANAKRMTLLANTPIANWYGGWNSDVQSDVNSYVSAATSAANLPVLVAYNIPDRDCGGHSSGGAASSDDYLNWIRSFAAGIGSRPADVILEPDALAGLDCLSPSDQTTRLQLLSQAVSILKSQTQAKVYLDAGNPNWQTTQVMAKRLEAANISAADGFSLNISNFITTNDNITYGNNLSSLIGNKHYVIDTSRNGNGPTSDYQWCNPAGRAVGALPTLSTGNNLVDAFLWVKGPGQSDGNCGPAIGTTIAPAAGIFWPAAADQMLANANY